MKNRLLVWLVIPLLFSIVVFFVRSGGAPISWGQGSSGPVLDIPHSLNLGERELGEEIIAPFTISNRGHGELVIDDVRSSCTCSVLERWEDGRSIPVSTLHIETGESVELVARVSVRTTMINGSMRSTISLRTNDPERPSATIDVIIPRVCGGIVTKPTSVVFGKVKVGETASQVIDVWDTATKPRTVKQAVSSDDERFGVRLLPIERTSGEGNQTMAGVLIARCEVTVKSRTPGFASGFVYLYLDGETRQPDALPISVHIVGLVEVYPTVAVLPRTSAAGTSYHCNCLCRSSEGQPLKVAVESVPQGIKAEVIPDKQDPGTVIVRIECDPRLSEQPTESRFVRLRARIMGKETSFQIPVITHERDEHVQSQR